MFTAASAAAPTPTDEGGASASGGFPGRAGPRSGSCPSAAASASAIATEARARSTSPTSTATAAGSPSAAAAPPRAGRPWVLQPHGTFPHHGQFPRAKAVFDRCPGIASCRQARALLAVSEAEARDLPAAGTT